MGLLQQTGTAALLWLPTAGASPNKVVCTALYMTLTPPGPGGTSLSSGIIMGCSSSKAKDG
jgi:hypothetical protein